MVLLSSVTARKKGFTIIDMRYPQPRQYTPYREIRMLDLKLNDSEKVFEVRIHLSQDGVIPVECKSMEKANEFFDLLVSLMET